MAVRNYHYEFRWILLGSSGVGKSCILRRIDDPESDFKTGHTATIGVDFKTKTIQVEDKTIRIRIWDTAGQERFEAITNSYYRNVVGGFLVFDVKDRKSFIELSKWVRDAKEGAHPRELILVLVGNKVESDAKCPRLVSQQEAQDFADNFKMEYIETSAKTGQNIDELVPFLASRVYWKLRVGHIVLKDGWQGVTESPGDLNAMAELSLSEHQPPLSKSDTGSRSWRCCN